MSGREKNKSDVIAPPRDAPAKTSRYRVMGEGSSIGLSAVSIAGLLALWWIATELVWVKPLFLPKPSAIWLAFQQAIAGDLDGHTLWVHFFWSMYRVFAAFLMAVAIGIPKSAWAYRATCAASSIRPSSSTGRCRRWPTCR